MTDSNFLINSAAVSDRGLSEKRPQNEDSYLEMPNLGLFAVADGVGGAQAGDVASQMAMEILSEAFVNLQANGDAEEMMRLAIERANDAIYQMSADLPQLSTMATTIVALHLSGSIATIGHVGDSRLYRLDQLGSLYRETQDHSVVEEEVRAGRMTAEQAANHPSRNVISRALGAEQSVEVDMKTIMFDPDTTFLLCSDGITRHISDYEIRELLLSSQNPSEICSRMKEICYSRGAEDNLTAVIVKAVGAAQTAPAVGYATVPDLDEATVTAARPAGAATPAGFATPAADDRDDEIPTQNLQFPASIQTPAPSGDFGKAADPTAETPRHSAYTETDEQYLMEEPHPAFEETAPITAPSSPPAAAAAAAAAVAPTARAAPPNAYQTAAPPPTPSRREPDFTVFTEREKSGSSAFGKILSSLLLLLLGAGLGAGAFYLWAQSNPAPASSTPLTPQTDDIAVASFEKVRREAYRNPDSVIGTYEKTPPSDAADWYLRGRAKLQKKDYEGAKMDFLTARNLLVQEQPGANSKILEEDITVGLTLAQDRNFQLAFEREKRVAFGGDAPATEAPAGNADANAPPPANR